MPRLVLRLLVSSSLLAIACGSGGPVGPGGLPSGVYDTYPHDGATGINPQSDVLVEFAAPMNASTVQVTSTPALGYSAGWSGNYLELSRGFSGSLQNATLYTVTVAGKTQAGDSISHTFSFTTGTTPTDTTAPVVVSTSPVNGAADVNPSSHVTFHFSEPMRFTTVHSDPALGTMTWNAAGDVLDFAPPVGSFLRGSTTSITLTGSDLFHNALSGAQLSFQVPEAAAPLAVTGISPADGSTIPNTVAISLSFSRDMDPTSTAAAISVSPSNSCSGQSQWINPRLYRCVPFTPADGALTVSVGTGAKDAAGNALATAWSASFTVSSSLTDTTPLSIVSFTPADGSTGVANGTPISITFSKPMDRGTVEAHFRQLLNTITGHFQWNDASTQVSFVPTSNYAAGLVEQWTVDSAEDLFGNSIYEYPTIHQFTALGLGESTLLPASSQAVTAGTLGSRGDALGMLLIGDDQRNQGEEAFLGFDLSAIPGAGTARGAVRDAYLILPRVGCEGSVANLGGTLFVDDVSPGASIDPSDLTQPSALSYPVTSPCSGPEEIFVQVTDKVRAAFGAGGLTQFRLRFPEPSNNDGTPDRLVLDSRGLLQGPRLRVVYELR